MDRDRKEGVIKQQVGKLKETLGRLTGDKKTEAEGRSERVEGKVQNTVGSAKDAARGRK